MVDPSIRTKAGNKCLSFLSVSDIRKYKDEIRENKLMIKVILLSLIWAAFIVSSIAFILWDSNGWVNLASYSFPALIAVIPMSLIILFWEEIIHDSKPRNSMQSLRLMKENERYFLIFKEKNKDLFD